MTDILGMQLCKACQEIPGWLSGLRDIHGKFDHHHSYASLYQSARAGCKLCQVLQSGLLAWMEDYAANNPCRWGPSRIAIELHLRRLARSDEKFYLIPREGYEFSWEVEPRSSFTIDALAYIYDPLGMDSLVDAPHFRLTTRRAADVSSVLGRIRDEGANFGLAHSWLEQCLDQHACKRPEPGNLPSRLLRIKSENQNVSVCLVDSGDVADPRTAYIALSHVWGEIKPCITTTENYASHAAGIKVDDLPKSFCDAVTVCRSLKVEYLWIDSLCIVQDSREDWEAECPRMSSVYSNALLTIAAADAPNSSAGFLHQYPRLGFGPFEIVHPSNPRGSVLIQYTPARAVDAYGNMTSRLSKRGWVMQERLLSSRILSFRSDRMLWECYHHCRSDEYHLPFKIEASLNGIVRKQPVAAMRDARAIYKHWLEIVTEYSKCALTKRSDKLPALSGISTLFSSVLSDRYVAGIWQHDMHAGLAWYSGPHTCDSSKVSPHSSDAPSWSWAASDCPVRFQEVPRMEDERLAGPKPLSVQSLLDEREGPGSSVTTALVVNVHLAAGVQIRRPYGSEKRHGEQLEGRRHGQVVADVYLDCGQLSRVGEVWFDQTASTAFCLLRYRSEYTLRWLGLVLEEVDVSGPLPIYRRIGLAQSPSRFQKGSYIFEKTKSQVVKII